METKKNKKIILIIVCVSIAVAALCISFVRCSIDKEVDISIRPIIEMGDVVDCEKEIEVLRTAKMDAGLLDPSTVSDMILGMSSEVDAANTFRDFLM